jgi:hypothetical protein
VPALVVGVEDHEHGLAPSDEPLDLGEDRRIGRRAREVRDPIVPRPVRIVGDIDRHDRTPVEEVADRGEKECAAAIGSAALHDHGRPQLVQQLLVDP